MDALPDEILLLIMSLVEDGMTLLDSVPLVCRRWRRLSREPAAWADVDIHVGLIHPPDDAARLLLHAPTLRQLHMEEAPPARVDSALRRGRVVALAEVSAAVVTTGVLDLLWRSRHRLYSASLALDEEAGLVRDSTGLRSPMAVVAGLQRLRILRLNEHSIAYGGELKDCAPALFHLDVRKWTSSALVTHVLNGAADTLRIVSVEDPPVALSAEQLQYFARCKHLWRLTLMHVPDHQNLRCLEAVRGSQSLHELCVSFRGPQEPLHTAHSILDTLALCRTMPALKYVSFRSDVNFHGSPPVLVSLYKRVYRKISAAFEHFRPDVEVDVFTHTA